MTDDRIDLGTAVKLINGEHPMATCPKDDEPLISTLRYRGAEFICWVCKTRYGFLAPKPARWTQELQDRHDELRAEFKAAVSQRGRYAVSDDRPTKAMDLTPLDYESSRNLMATTDDEWRRYLAWFAQTFGEGVAYSDLDEDQRRQINDWTKANVAAVAVKATAEPQEDR